MTNTVLLLFLRAMCLSFLFYNIHIKTYHISIVSTTSNNKTVIQAWILAFRPRTLFLAAAGVILGSGLAMHVEKFDLATALLTLTTALLLQLLSNLANDLGDYSKGTDRTGERVGPMRGVQSGRITPLQMKIGIGITALITMASGLILLLRLFHTIGFVAIVLFLIVGFFSLLAALFYTLVNRPYGYIGLGDFFAFLFFGPIAVIGAYYLQTQMIDLRAVFPSIGMGLLSSMILNVNNMRDIENDAQSGKRTIAVRIGLAHAKVYHTVMMLLMFACFLIYSFMYANSPWYRFLYILIYLYQFVILVEIFKKEGRCLDPYLSKTALSAFLVGIVFSICINV